MSSVLTFPADFPVLNEHLSTRSFIEFTGKPSSADVEVLKSLGASPVDAKLYPHVARWARCVAFNVEKKSICNSQCEIANLILKTASVSVSSSKANDDDVDLFGSDEEEDAEAEALKAKRLAEYNAKKAAKPVVIAKSLVTMDVKPWEDTTDLVEMEKCIREIEMDGLVWGSSKLVPIGYGIRKLQISCAIEDAKVSMDSVEELIVGFEDLVQSIDIVSFNKL
ncbi:Translation elongation factor 1 beta [Mitosporidium daphniae]|uniref:Elongation factor 1-beta n=1 Tax=Mitosporidium daphniae TaxID=1485682 RepID=A0A098VWT9_9MICR|nr:uncharacterized protein DI09_19p130 [Mitosporidium daphniae]KGG52231.1 hypothetical protein DI09_19p130 [Mitosporidium daphniae]|eukprot:XP_013238658.1 uncharacterized protein DI09_19p130 [Mitosporidium daphniae]